MEDRELRKIEEQKENLKKQIDKIYNTISLTQESLATEEMCSIVMKMDKEILIEFAKSLDTFGKCVLYYKTPIELRLDVDFINVTRVEEDERLLFWKDYKEKLSLKNLNPEEEYNKIIMMALILHVPITEKKSTKDDILNLDTENNNSEKTSSESASDEADDSSFK